MKRIASFLVAPLAFAVLAPGSGAAPAPARVQVSAVEFALSLSRSAIRSGGAVIELVNYGEDDHDLALRRGAPGARTLHLGIVHPAGTADLEARLLPGRYVLWCTLADHRARGMRAVLIVRSS